MNPTYVFQASWSKSKQCILKKLEVLLGLIYIQQFSTLFLTNIHNWNIYSSCIQNHVAACATKLIPSSYYLICNCIFIIILHFVVSFTHCPPARYSGNLNHVILKWKSWIDILSISCEIYSDECQKTSLLVSQHSSMWWLGAVRQQADSWTNFNTDLCHHMTSPATLNEDRCIL